MEEARIEEGGVEARQCLVEKIWTALQGTSNKSALGPDRVSYKLIKLAVKGPLGDTLFEQIAEELSNGTMPEEWQACKVVTVMITQGPPRSKSMVTHQPDQLRGQAGREGSG